jgi:hypothetical protein
MSQFLHQPSPLTVLSGLPATFDDLAAAFSIGKFSSTQAASLLTGAPLLSTPARSLLLGSRVLSYSGQATLSYAYSSRLNFHFSSFTAAGQNRRNSKNDIPEERNVLPRSQGLNGGAGFDYALSPRTQIGLSAENNYVINKYQKAYTNTISASFGRKMGMHWFMSLNGGMSLTKTLEQTYSTPRTRQAIGGGSLGFRTYQHTLVATYGRTSSDMYGFAVGTNTVFSGSWSWRRPGATWSIQASGSQQQMRRTGFISMSGWETSAGFVKRLNNSLSLNAQYVFLNNAGTFAGTYSDLRIHSIRISLGWAPEVSRR